MASGRSRSSGPDNVEARRVTASFSVSPQIMAADIEEARAAGFVQIVN
ncbi:MAG: beta-lactamase hydrolase domain-containing protein, partial [Caulobacteraceae bacterium]